MSTNESHLWGESNDHVTNFSYTEVHSSVQYCTDQQERDERLDKLNCCLSFVVVQTFFLCFYHILIREVSIYVWSNIYMVSAYLTVCFAVQCNWTAQLCWTSNKCFHQKLIFQEYIFNVLCMICYYSLSSEKLQDFLLDDITIPVMLFILRWAVSASNMKLTFRNNHEFNFELRLPSFKHQHPFDLSEGGASGLPFHQVGALLNGCSSLNVPIKGSEVVGQPFPVWTLREPWCVSTGGLHFSFSSSLAFHLFPFSNHSCYILTVKVMLCGT